MANPYIGYRCPRDVYDALEKYLAKTQQEKSEFLISLIRKELGIEKNSTLSDRVEKLEASFKTIDLRVAVIEARLNKN